MIGQPEVIVLQFHNRHYKRNRYSSHYFNSCNKMDTHWLMPNDRTMTATRQTWVEWNVREQCTLGPIHSSGIWYIHYVLPNGECNSPYTFKDHGTLYPECEFTYRYLIQIIWQDFGDDKFHETKQSRVVFVGNPWYITL